MHCSLSQHSVWVVDCDCALPRPVFLWEEGGTSSDSTATALVFAFLYPFPFSPPSLPPILDLLHCTLFHPPLLHRFYYLVGILVELLA